MYNSHFVPKMILNSFSNHIDIYDIQNRKLNRSLIDVESFFVPGLYDNEVEILINRECEIKFSIINEKKGINLSSEELLLLRKYLLISFLRTPYFCDRFKDKQLWNSILEKIILGDELNESIRTFDFTKEELDRLSILVTGSIKYIYSKEKADPYLISDLGVTFVDRCNAIYPYSGHEAIWISKNDFDNQLIDEETVLNINSMVISQAYEQFGMTSIDDVLKSILHYNNQHPNDEKIRPLIVNVSKLESSESHINDKIRLKSGIPNLTVPTKLLEIIDSSLNETIAAMIKKKDYDTLSSIEVLRRFEIIKTDVDVMNHLSKIGNNRLKEELERYVDNSECEFDKCIGVIFLEIASERGFGKASDKLRLYYKKGNHVRMDLKRSDYYLHKGCTQGHPDCLIAYLKQIGPNDNADEMIEKYSNKIPWDSGTILQTIAIVYKDRDEDKYLEYLERAANTGYTGAITRWVDYWVKNDPDNIEKIESMNHFIFNGKHAAATVLAKYYLNHEGMCPGKYELLVSELKKNDSVYLLDVLDMGKRKSSD